MFAEQLYPNVRRCSAQVDLVLLRACPEFGLSWNPRCPHCRGSCGNLVRRKHHIIGHRPRAKVCHELRLDAQMATDRTSSPLTVLRGQTLNSNEVFPLWPSIPLTLHKIIHTNSAEVWSMGTKNGRFLITETCQPNHRL